MVWPTGTLERDLRKELIMSEETGCRSPAFSPGRIVLHRSVLRVNLNEAQVYAGMERHIRADWGEVDARTAVTNRRALVQKEGRLISLFRTEGDTIFRIVTSSKRRTTKVSGVS